MTDARERPMPLTDSGRGRREQRLPPHADKPAPASPLRALLAALAAAVAVPAVAADPLPVAPPPREVRPDGSRDPAPGAAKAEDPADVVNRIVANAKQASDKLAMTDAGEGTRATQSTILKDIDKLLDPPDSPPKGGGGDSSDMNKQDKGDGKGDGKNDQKDPGKNDGMGNDPKGGMNPGKGGTDKDGGKGGNDPKGGMNPGGMAPGGGEKGAQANAGRRPRMGQPKDGKEPGGSANAGQKNNQPPAGKAPSNSVAKNDPKTPPNAGGATDGKTDRPPPPLSAPLPLADEVAKEVWGHLPEGLRQQMSQYYREEFMPRYAGLLRQYYSSLANTPNGSTAPPPAPPR